MLRRNFLKICGLIPFISILPAKEPAKEPEKWYAMISLCPGWPIYEGTKIISYLGNYEVELECGSIPQINQMAFIGKTGKCHNFYRKQAKPNAITGAFVGHFLTERYTKN